MVITAQGHRLDTVPSPPDPHDFTYAAVLGATAPPPPSARIAAIDRTPVLDQGQLGSCTSNASVGARALFLPSYLALSRLFHYYLERKLEGTIGLDSGASVRDAGKVLQKYGACLESEDPYKIATFRSAPTAKEMTDAAPYRITAYYTQPTTTDVRRALSFGHPVLMGFAVDEAFENTGSNGIVSIGGKQLGGHCTYLWGYDTDAHGAITYHGRNSWGTGWGDHGNFHVSDAWLKNSTIVFDLWSLSA